MKTKSNILLSLGLTGLMGFTLQMREAPKNFRGIASDEKVKEEVKVPNERDKLATLKKELEDKKARLIVVEALLVDYTKQETDANNPEECKDERPVAEQEQKDLIAAIEELEKKKIPEQELLAKTEQEADDKRLAEEEKKKIEEEKKKLEEEKKLLAEEKEKLKEEKDAITCEKEKQQDMLTSNPFFGQLFAQQQMIMNMQTMFSQMIFSQYLQNQFSLINRVDHMDIGQGSIGQRTASLNSVLGMSQNYVYMPTVYNLNQVPEREQQQQQQDSQFYEQSYDSRNAWIPASSVTDVSRNPMYVPSFNGFRETASGLPGGLAVPFRFDQTSI